MGCVFNMKFENYQILENIGRGGMGEVLLAHDSVCGRDVALKRIRKEWADKKTMQDRFLREARIAAQLSHPNIIPIYEISDSYYTMPYIEGETLKEILKRTKEQVHRGDPLHPIGSSVPALIRIFLNVCSAVGYAHSKGVLHRDLKPENIIVGKFGEVIILDWGLADFIDLPENNGLDFKEGSPHLTQPGKIPGTLLFMAPERAFGAKSSILTDIYSLGVTLYQILTLQFPFHRKTLKEYKKVHELETIHDPEEIAPDRDISPHLSNIAKKCLTKDPEERFQSMEELIKELENYIEGNPEWLEAGELKIERKDDWQFQENIALGKHRALTRGIEMVEWFNLMISKSPFPGNLQIETELTLKEGNQGVGILFCIPENNFSKGLEESYCLWLSEEGTRLYRADVEVFNSKQTKLEKNRTYKIRITHIENHVRLFIDGTQKFGFLSHIPLPGSRIGLLLRDGNFSLPSLNVSVGSQNIMVNCLAIPDAFLARKDYDEALREYRKISDSFPGRAEGREATFRAGLTLLKKAERQRHKVKKEELFSEALNEFEMLHNTPGAPLEYLGKSLVYKAQGELEEEAKCLELALRKYPKHPLKPILVENILTRLHESSQNARTAAYLFALIVLRHLPRHPEAEAIGDILQKSLEPLPFFAPSENRRFSLITQLAFWLNKPMVLYELLEKKELDEIDEQNAHIALILLGHEDLADPAVMGKATAEILHANFEKALKQESVLPEKPIQLWHALYEKRWDDAKKIIETVPSEKLSSESDPHFFLYGCYLAKEKGEEEALKHLTNISEKAFPPTSSLLSHYLMGRINLKKGWIDRAFFWEKLKLLQQIELYCQCLGDEKLKKTIKSQAKNL